MIQHATPVSQRLQSTFVEQASSMIQHATSSLAKIKTLPNTFVVALYGWLCVYILMWFIVLTKPNLNETKGSIDFKPNEGSNETKVPKVSMYMYGGRYSD